MAEILNNIGMLIGSAGIFFGFFHHSNHPQLSLEIVTVTTVAITGFNEYRYFGCAASPSAVVMTRFRMQMSFFAFSAL